MRHNNRQQIAIFRALHLGDMLCAVPALRALRQAYPAAEITLIGLPWAKDFVKRFHHYIDRFIAFPGYSGLPEQNTTTAAIAQFLKKVRRKKFDLLIQMHGDGSVVNPLMYDLHAKTVAGFFLRGTPCPNPQLFLAYPEQISEVEKLLTLMRFLHIPAHNGKLEFPLIREEEIQLLLSPLFKQICNTPYVCIHPGARNPQRRWNPTYFAFVADDLAKRGFSIILTGTRDEYGITRKIASLMHYPSINLAGKTDLGRLAALLSYAQLLISNCTSVSHIADALNVPSVVVYLTSNPEQWAPANKQLHRVIQREKTGTPYFVLRDALLLLYESNYPVQPSYKLIQKEEKS